MANNPNHKDNLKPATKGEVRNPKGRPAGVMNRNTIARKVLAMDIDVPSNLYDYFKVLYPNLPKKMSVEQLATLSIARKAINGDYLPYKTLMDSAYGAPKQEIDMTSEGERINPSVTIINTGAKLSTSEKDVEVHVFPDL
jgi:hypothetical protein